ncbi:hypothetical protein TNCV_3508061 [Trichonephila clavipes]|uniref:Uncharacterized protein n=1 Tax=Trichonephila clavipes TaxID=2585209 RepID=A0A8X6RZB7_TRICX|nr:hypothetical protein TNCV_3508061 [Trichonephila clavipes]
MRPLEDAGKNRWTMVDFRVLIVAVDLGPRQIGRADSLSDQLSVPDLSLSTIRRVTRIRVATMILQRQLIERNLRSYQTLRHLPLTPARYVARLQWCLARSG